MKQLKLKAWDRKEKLFIPEDRLQHWTLNAIAHTKHRYIFLLYSGRSDSNKQEICEGDILQGIEHGECGSVISRWLSIIKWDDENTALVAVDPVEGDSDKMMVSDILADKIIGNVFEHPEKADFPPDWWEDTNYWSELMGVTNG